MGFGALLIGIFVVLLIKHNVNGQVCPNGWLEWNSGNSCYKINSSVEAKSWSDARLSCQAYQGDLVVINSKQEQIWLRSRLQRISPSNKLQWWYGASDLNEQKRWQWIDGSVVSGDMITWGKNEPNNFNGNEHCMQMLSDAVNDNDCANPMAYICERPKDQPLKCDVDNGWDNYHGYCYKFFSDKKTWIESHNVCRNQGGRLLHIFLESLENYVTDVVAVQKQNTWIGLRSVKQKNGAVWTWTYQNFPLSGVRYWSNNTNSRILSGEANSSCVEISSHSTDLNAWNKADCGERKAFMCEKPEGVCPKGWLQYQSKCYELRANIPMSWPAANAHCRAHGQNGTLLEISSQQEQAFINMYLGELSESGTGKVWIGITDDNKGVFRFSSGGDLDSGYSNWIKMPVDTKDKFDCGTIFTGDKAGKWSVTSNCLQANAFICQLPTDVMYQPVNTPSPQQTCDRGWLLYNGHCYLFNDSASDWQSAHSNCIGQAGDLASISDNYTQAFLNGHITTSLTWIGYNDRNSESDFKWTDGSQSTYRNWIMDSPSVNSETNCVGMVSISDHIGQWTDAACSETHGFLCQKLASSTEVLTTAAPNSTAVYSSRCGEFWEEDVKLGFCYSFQDQLLTWMDANLWCTNQGGTLASINSLQEQYFIIGRVRTMSSFAVWIGANDRDVNGGWKWTDNSPFAFLNWKPGEPNHLTTEDCVNIVVKSGLWNNYRCDARNGFICKKPNGVLTTAKPPTTLSVHAGQILGCPSGWKSFRNHCYLFKAESGNRAHALSACRQQSADLVSMADESEQNFVSSQTRGYGQYWIGLDDQANEWSFTWTDRSPVTYTAWSKFEPNNFENKDEDCVSMYAHGDGHWNDQLCNYRAAGYVCKAPKRPITTTTVKPGCPAGSFVYRGMCYIYMDNKRNWEAAEAKCRTMQGHLATIPDQSVQAFVSSELSTKSGQYWIGLSDSTTRGIYKWVSNMTFQFSFWDRSHTGKERGTCISMSADKPVGLWKNQNCNGHQGAICEVQQFGYTTETPTTTIAPIRCPGEWSGFQDFCYKAFKSYSKQSKKSWSEAVDHCQGLGGQLVSILNKSENDFIGNTLLRFSSNSDFWMGLSQRDLTKGLKWVDGSGFNYNNWAPDQPDNVNNMENCVVYNGRSKAWSDVNCLVANNWICKLRKGVTPPTTAVPPTAVTSPSCGGSDLDWKHFHGMCYYVSIGNKKSWFQARSWCQQHGGHLASIGNQGENDIITSLTAKLSYQAYWIGLNRLNLGAYEWSDSTSVKFINWAKNEPNDAHNSQLCANFYNDKGAWNDDNCGDLNEFICKKVNGSYSPLPTHPTTVRPGNCPRGFHGFKSKCYFLGGNTPATRLNWADARDKCQSFGHGYDIASIGSAEEQAFLTSLLETWNTSLWIGLNDLFNEGKFVWHDNSYNDFTNWADREPSQKGYVYYSTRQEDCVNMYSEDYHAGKWNDESCSRKHGYVCEVYKNKTFLSQTTISPSWCKPGYTLFGKSCYKLISQPTTWFSAKSACEHDGSNLVSITDIYEQSAVRVLTKDISQPVWLGLHDAEVSGIYSWVDGWPILFSNWGQDEPSKGVGEGCVAFLLDGKWNDTKCNQAFPAVCKLTAVSAPPNTTPFPGDCKDPTWKKWGHHCYVAELKSKTSFADASFECERLGMQMVSVHSILELEFIRKLVASSVINYGKKDIWIGLYKGAKGGFMWKDKTAVDYVSWEHGEPSDASGEKNENCVEQHYNTGHWNDVPCRNLKGYVCKTTQKEFTSTTRVSATSPPIKQSSASQPIKQTTPSRSNPLATTENKQTRNPLSPGSFTPSPKFIGHHLSFTSNTDESHLSTGAIAGICLGCIFCLAILVAVAVVYKQRHRSMFKMNGSSVGFDNALFSSDRDTVNIQTEFPDSSTNGHIHSSST